MAIGVKIEMQHHFQTVSRKGMLAIDSIHSFYQQISASPTSCIRSAIYAMGSYIQQLYNSLIELYIVKDPELPPNFIRIDARPSTNFSKTKFSWIVRI